MTSFPTAREIAVAVVTAARLHDDDPVLTIEGAMGVRGRWLAIAALIDRFPGVPPASIGLWCGIRGGVLVKGALKEKLRANWWNYAHAESVAKALAAEIAKTDAGFASDNSEIEPTDAQQSSAAHDVDEPGALDVADEVSPQAFAQDIAEYEAREAKTARIGAAIPPKPQPPSAAARALADFHRARPNIIRTARGHVVDHCVEGVVDMGDPPPGRSALSQARAVTP